MVAGEYQVEGRGYKVVCCWYQNLRLLSTKSCVVDI